MQKQVPSINLVKKKVDYIDEFIKWALSIGRLVVILTEAVALITFIYRFSLDRQLIDLHSKILQEQAIVASLKDQEETYRNLQDRVAIAAEVSKQSSDKVKVYLDIQKNIPQDATFNNLSVFEEGTRINVTFKSVSGISKFVDFLKNYEGVESVSIDKIENKSSSASILVGITVLFKEAKSSQILTNK